MVVQLDELQKQTVYQMLAPYDLEGYQSVVEMVIIGDADARMILSLVKAVWEEGKAAGYRDGVRWGENYGAETALKFFQQVVKKNGKPTADNKGQTKAEKL